MRRQDREVTNMDEIITIMKKCDVCRLALFDEEFPYIIPMNFGFTYQNGEIELYFHCAKAGKKLDLINLNPKVGFEMDCSHRLILDEKDC
ncbi:MAG: pyridoxamine 5'-phosphate oxidase family protein, partial [Herbinix sp.]|nr:pyridoxamine 5'-phosphate oxidase family protein [Herbinix sp.]